MDGVKWYTEALVSIYFPEGRVCCDLCPMLETFDAKRFQKEHPELDLTGYYNTTNFKRFSIKEEKET